MAHEQLCIRLFGPPAVARGGAPLARTRTRKELWLLALLALRAGKIVDREWLASTLWPDTPQESALGNLRRSLMDLRRVLGPDAARLTAPSTRTIRFDAEDAFVDVLAFDSAVARTDEPSLENAVALYRGSLLEGCYETWAIPEREAREQAFLGALEKLAALREQADDPASAARYLRRAISVDALQEHLYRDLMRCEARTGDYAAVTQTYRDLRLLLRKEVNSEPSAETTALFQQLRVEARDRTGQGIPIRSVSERQATTTPSPPPSLRTNLPQAWSSFIGRTREMADTRQILARSRLLTLTGSGGAGKTRLALELARGLQDDYPDGIWFVELASLENAGLVAHAVASVLGVREVAGQPIANTLTTNLGPKSCLILLDNCEHLLPACAGLAQTLLRYCAHLRLLITSREPLKIAGEQVYRVPSLLTPDPTHLPAEEKELAAIVLDYEAPRLFVERASLQKLDFTLTRQNASVVASLCHRLDGIPLAIELAAARVSALSVEEIHSRLEHRFRLLRGGSRTVLPRQQSLQAAIDWSYELLTEPERLLLSRLSVFAGGWTLEAAEAVCSDEQIEDFEVLDQLASLVDKSLVIMGEWEGKSRYRLLETIREYAAERLKETREDKRCQSRHLEYFLALAEEAEPQLIGAEQAQWLERLQSEHDNLRAALKGCRQDEERNEAGLRLAASLFRFWDIRGYLGEGREHLQAALMQDGRERKTPVRAKALNAAGVLAKYQSDFAIAQALYQLDFALATWRNRQHVVESAAA